MAENGTIIVRRCTLRAAIAGMKEDQELKVSANSYREGTVRNYASALGSGLGRHFKVSRSGNILTIKRVS